MVQSYTDAIDCECFITGDYCVCEKECECGCPDCNCQGMSEQVVGGCACGGNCMCNQSEDETDEGDLE